MSSLALKALETSAENLVYLRAELPAELPCSFVSAEIKHLGKFQVLPEAPTAISSSLLPL